MENDHSGYDDNSESVPTCGPDWGGLETSISNTDWGKEDEDWLKGAYEEFRAEFGDVAAAKMIEFLEKGIEKLMLWPLQNCSFNLNGIAERQILLAWVFVKRLRPYTLTALAKNFHLKKQSLGRHVETFKKDHPWAKTSNMINEGK